VRMWYRERDPKQWAESTKIFNVKESPSQPYDNSWMDGWLPCADTLRHDHEVTCIVTQKQYVICGDKGGRISIWDLRGKDLHQLKHRASFETLPRSMLEHKGEVRSLALDFEAWLVSASSDGNVYVYRRQEGTNGGWTYSLEAIPLKHRVKNKDSTEVLSVAIQPRNDGDQMVVVSGASDGSIKIWEISKLSAYLAPKQVCPAGLQGITNVNALAVLRFEDFGRFDIASGHSDNELKIWS